MGRRGQTFAPAAAAAPRPPGRVAPAPLPLPPRSSAASADAPTRCRSPAEKVPRKCRESAEKVPAGIRQSGRVTKPKRSPTRLGREALARACGSGLGSRAAGPGVHTPRRTSAARVPLRLGPARGLRCSGRRLALRCRARRRAAVGRHARLRGCMLRGGGPPLRSLHLLHLLRAGVLRVHVLCGAREARRSLSLVLRGLSEESLLLRCPRRRIHRHRRLPVAPTGVGKARDRSHPRLSRMATEVWHRAAVPVVGPLRCHAARAGCRVRRLAGRRRGIGGRCGALRAPAEAHARRHQLKVAEGAGQVAGRRTRLRP